MLALTAETAHKAYGKALGLTESKRPKASTPDVRAAMDEFYAALRLYVVRASASADEDDPGSAERAAALLAPIEDAESLGRGPAAPRAVLAGPGGPRLVLDRGAREPRVIAAGVAASRRPRPLSPSPRVRAGHR